MAIVAYTGLPRQGKSYGVVENVLIPAIEAGRDVYTNLALKLDVIAQRYPDARIFPFDLKSVREDPGWLLDEEKDGAVFIFDEIWELWPSGMKANYAPIEYRNFLTMHGHRVNERGDTCEIILITQDLNMLASFARQLVQNTYIATKLSAVGATKKYRIDVYTGAIGGQSGPVAKRINQLFGTYKPEVYELYTSHTQSKGIAGKEEAVDKRASVWRNPMLRVGAVATVAFLIFGVWGVSRAFSGDAYVDEHPAVVAKPASLVPVHPKGWRPRSPAPVSSWRLTGVIQFADGHGVAELEGANHVTRRISLDKCRRDAFAGWSCQLQAGVADMHSGPALAGFDHRGFIDRSLSSVGGAAARVQ